jgi:L-lactate dehydrogenase
MPNAPRPTRIAIIGAGYVGATTAYTLLASGAVSEIVLIDSDHARAEGEAMDLNHAVPLMRPARVWAGDYADCAGAVVTIIAAGSGQEPGETRLDLVGRNAEIFREIVPRIVSHNPEGILLVATNPVDVLTHLTWKLSALPREQVIGSGTVLDTARFRHRLSWHFGVDPRSVHAHIIGEHGDSEVPVWSLANIAGMRLPDYCAANSVVLDEPTMRELFEQTRRAAYDIIARKGATYFAIAAALRRIVEAILRDEHTLLTVSSPVSGYLGVEDVSLGVPAVVGRQGVERLIALDLSPDELARFAASAATLTRTLAALPPS